jgi:hypothetical protein
LVAALGRPRTYAKKYKPRWPGEIAWEDLEPKYCDGFRDGSRVLIRYTAKES